MATSQFHGFLSLPLEIRQEIYKLATSPRFVHVKHVTEQDYDTFKENLRLIPNYLHLDEALAHFSFNWRTQIPSHSNYPTLEAFGFSSNRLPYRPWEVTSSAPRICLHWLACNPRTAWQFVRESYLYSPAPIPALLHTCSESRHELMKRGYRLAFGTRSSWPQTWFNYDHDILFLSAEGRHTDHRILSGCHWDLSQFDPEDMRRVRRIALERSSGSLFLAHPRFRNRQFKFHDLTSVLRLFGHINELFLVEWTDEYMLEMCEPEEKTSLKKRHSYDSRGSWSYQDVSEVDALQQLFPPDAIPRRSLTSAGSDAELLDDYKEMEESNFFDLVITALREQLFNRRSEVTLKDKDQDVWWEIPIIKNVHVMTDLGHEALYRERSRVLQTIAQRRQTWLIQGDTARNDTALLQEEGSGDGDDLRREELEEATVNARRRWWIEKGIVPFLNGPGR